VFAQLYFNICNETVVKLRKQHWYKHVPKSVETSHGDKEPYYGINKWKVTGKNPNNKPDTITRDNEKGRCVLRDSAFSGDRNVIKVEADKLLKHKLLKYKQYKYSACGT
jgi:hypothetical protein